MGRTFYSTLILLCFLCSYNNLVISTASPSTSEKRCDEINIPMCRGIGYNYTKMPNEFNHDSQEEAGLEVHQFWPLVEIQCSDDLKFFLCSMYTPICIEDYAKPLPACQSVCNRAKAGCAPIMSQYGFGWPDRMNCEALPKFGDQNNLCMDSKNGAEPTVSPYSELFNPSSPKSPSPTSKVRGPTIGGRPLKPATNKNSTPTRQVVGDNKPVTVPSLDLNLSPPLPTNTACKCECRQPLIKLEDFLDRRYFNRVETGGVANCGQPCHSIFVKQELQEQAVLWISITAGVCFVATCLTVLTSLIDQERFKYPQRSVIYLSGCYLMVSAGFLVRWWMGHDEISCDGPLIRYHGTGPAPVPCFMVFVLVYFFGMAAWVWWVILCFTWFLAAGLKWGSEAIEGYAPYFHFLAFFVPTIKSLIILGMGAVDGDPFAGICSVGNLDSENLRKFILIPLFVYMIAGGVFLLAGFFSLFRTRKVIRQTTRAKTNKLEKLMFRMFVFSVLYVIPGSIVISCYNYEYKERVNWEKQVTCPCSTPPSHLQRPYLSHMQTGFSPPYYSFLLKYICTLVLGITSLVWILSPKTIDSWSRFFGRICCGTRSTVASSRSGGSQLIGSQYLSVNNHRLGVALNGSGSVYKQIPINQQISYSSNSHIESNCNVGPNSLHMKQVNLSHV